MDKKKLEQYKPALIWFLVMLAVSLFLPLNWGDDAIFADVTANKTLFEFLRADTIILQ